MLQRIRANDRQASTPIRIATSELRNHSRCGSKEFVVFRARFTELLNRAGSPSGVLFVEDPAEPAGYRLQGTAYLVSLQGFDQWELYLSLTPSDYPITIWSSDGPVRVLRDPRPGQPQISPP